MTPHVPTSGEISAWARENAGEGGYPFATGWLSSVVARLLHPDKQIRDITRKNIMSELETFRASQQVQS